MPPPTFLCIGPPKTASTWLAAAVSQHPDVTVGREKELGFFLDRHFAERSLDWYESQFTEGRMDAPAVGEFSPGYFFAARVPGHDSNSARTPAERIRAAYPDLRFVVCLRDPVSRTVSDYYQNVRRGHIRPGAPFAEVRGGAIWYSLYAAHLERWFELYDRDRFLILCYEEDVKQPEAKAKTLARVFDHIGLDSSFVPEGLHERENVRPPPFELRIRRMPRLVQAVMRRMPPAVKEHHVWGVEMPAEDRAQLAGLFRADVTKLEAMLGRSFPWPQTKGASSGA